MVCVVLVPPAPIWIPWARLPGPIWIPVAEVPPVRLERPRLLEIEAVFAEWGRFAIWSNETTEVALWDTEKSSYTIFYEVLRSGESYYFRSIPKLTRPILTHGAQVKSPLQFTETEESRREWLERDREIISPRPPEAATDKAASDTVNSRPLANAPDGS